MGRALRSLSPRLPPPGQRTLRKLDVSRIKEHLEVLTELLCLRGHWLRASLEEYSRYSEVLGGLFGDRSLVNIVDNAAAYLLCAFTCSGGRGLRTERVVEP